jgi:quercetin dioxygenase-like cupin family protein
MRTTYGAVAAVLVAISGQIAMAEDGVQMILMPGAASLQWQPGPANLPKGTQLVVLAGDPGKPGPFVLRVKFPPNTMVAPHTHATDENLTVLTGDFYHEMGETLDKARGDLMQPGGFVYLPANMPHSGLDG